MRIAVAIQILKFSSHNWEYGLKAMNREISGAYPPRIHPPG